MNGQTYSRGVLLWIDDRFASLANRPEELWEEIFGEESSRPYRLMDLSLELATSFENGLRAVERLTSADAAGTYVVCIVDLKIPRRSGEEDQTRYGIDIAKEVRRRNLPMFFLSSNSDASDILNEENLGTVQYYFKQTGLGPWRLPEDLARMILSEFRNHISWISLEDIVDTIHEESKIVATYRKDTEAFRYFPFFGPFRDFVWRWESRRHHDLPHAFVIKATVEHCSEFIQQSLLLILYQYFAQFPRTVRIHFGLAEDSDYLELLAADHNRRDSNAISALRVWPEKVQPEVMRRLIDESSHRAGISVFLVPNDESCDRYSELLNEYHIPIVDELPQIRTGDAGARSELITRTCALIFQRWSQSSGLGENQSLPMAYLAHPELLINPIHWTILHEARDVARALSDPYEISKELLDAIGSMTEPQRDAIRDAVKEHRPLPYAFHLRVGEVTLRGSDVESKLPEWVERALDEWLNTSWHFPYGLSKQFAQLETGGGTLADDEETRAELGSSPRSAWRCHRWEDWEDSCFETLWGMLREYRELRPGVESLSEAQGRRADLTRIYRFVTSLGGSAFLGERAQIDWEALESLRWPHHRYPMPAAINRRLKQHGRYLWIQPEGLDLASALPMGRIRYRMLASLVEQYSSVLTWTSEIVADLPRGWQLSVRYLADVIRGHRVAYEWEHNRRSMWYQLLGLVRNGAPMMYVVDQILRGGQLVGENGDTAQNFFSGIHGYGKILSKIRGASGRRLGTYLVSRWNAAGLADNLTALNQMAHLRSLTGERSQELHETLGEMFGNLLDLEEGKPRHLDRRLSAQWRDWMSDETLKLGGNEGWYTDGLCNSEAIPSLWGTKADHLWHTADAFSLLADVTYIYRYFDGYHFLAAINDLRVTGKDTCPRVRLAVIEQLLELFVASLEGLLAQLAWCLELHGHRRRAEAIRPPAVRIEPPEGFQAPPIENLEGVQRVRDVDGGYAVFTLGIPGRGQVDRFCYHDEESVVKLKGARPLVGTVL